MITSNQIHLLVVDDESDVVSKSTQLIAGSTAQAFNRRKGRKGAFWEDRYHATAVESGEHLLRCLVYMDMNMVRAGVVSHPSEWQHSGYHEIQSPPQHYRLIDKEKLIKLTGSKNDEQLRCWHRESIDSACQNIPSRRVEWAEALAVGSETLVIDMKKKMGLNISGRKVSSSTDAYILRDTESAYNVSFEDKRTGLNIKNTVYFNEKP